MTREELAELGAILDQAREVFTPRDYRKECWIAAYSAATSTGASNDKAFHRANQAVDEFDKVDFS